MDDKRIEALEQNIESVRKDFAEIGRSLRKLAEEKSSKLEQQARRTYNRFSDRAQDLWEDAQDYGAHYYDRARERFDDTVESATDKVRENPLQAVAIVAGISFIVGFLASRR